MHASRLLLAPAVTLSMSLAVPRMAAAQDAPAPVAPAAPAAPAPAPAVPGMAPLPSFAPVPGGIPGMAPLPTFAPGTPSLPAATPAPPPAPTSVWTTFKGDNQRSGCSQAKVSLPLSLLWRYSSLAPGRTYTLSPLVLGAPGQQRVYIAAGRTIYAFDAETGEQRWQNLPRLTTSVNTPPTVLTTDDGDYILVATQGGHLEAFRTADGSRAWDADAKATISDAGPIVVSTSKGKRIICAVGSGDLIAFTTDGKLDPDWHVTLGRFGTSPSSSMALSSDGTMLFIIGSDARIYAVDIEKMQVDYSIGLSEESTVTPVAIGDDVIACSARSIAGLQASSGNTVWSFTPKGEIVASPAAGTGTTGASVFFGTTNGAFYALSAGDGHVLWKTDLGAWISGSPLFLPKLVVVGTHNGLLIGLNPDDGTVIWQYRLKANHGIFPMATPPAGTDTSGGGGGGGGGGDNGGGRRRGGRGRFGGDPNEVFNDGSDDGTHVWGVTAAPAVVDGNLYVWGDNAALYAFTTRSFSADPPQVVEPSLAVPDEANKIAALLMTPDNPLTVPGRGPVYFAVQLDDTASGIDPASIGVTMDGTPVTGANLNYDVASGILTATLLDPAKGDTAFEDGLKNLVLTVSDYAGNKLTYNTSFEVDNTVAPPAAKEAPAPDNNGNPPDNGNNQGNGQ